MAAAVRARVVGVTARAVVLRIVRAHTAVQAAVLVVAMDRGGLAWLCLVGSLASLYSLFGLSIKWVKGRDW